MKKLVLSLALAAFLSAGSIAFASTTNTTDHNSETIEMMQDGKKKVSATKKDASKAVKTTDCKDKKSSTKSDCASSCKGKETVKKSCCSDGKTSGVKKSNPEKK